LFDVVQSADVRIVKPSSAKIVSIGQQQMARKHREKLVETTQLLRDFLTMTAPATSFWRVAGMTYLQVSIRQWSSNDGGEIEIAGNGKKA